MKKQLRSIRNQFVQQMAAKAIAMATKKIEEYVEENGEQILETVIGLVRK